MHITKNGVTISIADDEIVRLALERLNGSIDAASLAGVAIPRIGEMWTSQGGVYAGTARGRDGGPDYHLIVGPEHDGDIQWQPAMDWASTLIVDGLRDFTLPWPSEQSIAFGNVPELFQQRAYWSRKQHESGSSDAWGQDFNDGVQLYWGKVNELRARAFRRLAIQ